jgi:hypothetical protein
MFLTHTLLAQVAADRTADAERRVTETRWRRALGSRRTGFAGIRPATRAPQPSGPHVQPTARPNVALQSRPRTEAA